MEDRQKKILNYFLLNPEKNMLVQEIADLINVSEKTVRTDFKEIDKWLKEHSTATLVRKRSKGVYLELSSDERKRLMNECSVVQTIDDIYEDKRIFDILIFCLNKNKTFTIQELSERFYVTKNVIKKDLMRIDSFLRLFDLQLTKKQKVGIVVEGEELNRRNAMLRFLELSTRHKSETNEIISSLFDLHDFTFVQSEVRKMEQSLSLPLTEDSLYNIVIHILIAVQRIKLKNEITMSVDELDSIRKKKEYRLASELAKKMSSYFSLRFPENEVAYFALRILGGKYQYPTTINGNIETTLNLSIERSVSEFAEALILRISDLTNVDFTKDERLFNGLLIHLHSTYNRLRYHLPISNPMVNDIKKMYPYMFQVIYSVVTEGKDRLFARLPEEEMAYLTLHFQSALERLQKLNGENKRALIVCSMGIGMSQILRTKLERRFHSLEVVACISSAQLKQVNHEEIDFVITTVPVKTTIPTIEVSPLLFDHEQSKIETFIKSLEYNVNLPCLKSFLNERFIRIHLEASDRFEVIDKMTTELYRKGLVKKGYINSSIEREKTSSTAIGGGVAIPHGNPDEVIEPVILVATCKQPIQWGNEQVSLIFLLANKLTDSRTTKLLFRDLSNLSENHTLVEKMTRQNDVESFMALL